MPVTVRIRLLGIFRESSDKSLISVKLRNPTVRGAVLTLAQSVSGEVRNLLVDPETSGPRLNALILVNGKEINVLKGLDTALKNHDEVTFIPVSHGG